jgi:hypothetical protein
MKKLERAINKFRDKNNMSLNYDVPIDEFLLDCYLNCDPSSYGSYIQKKVELDCINNKIDIVSISPKENRGDFEILTRYSYDYRSDFEFEEVPDYNIPVVNFEFKTSFLGKTNGYTIRNIRPYQKMYGGYLICLIDCQNDFRKEFHLVSYETLSVIFNMTHMNGISSQHKDDGFKNYGVSFRKNSYEHRSLRRCSKLNGDTIEDLMSYLKTAQLNLRESIMNSPEVIKYMGGIIYKHGLCFNELSCYDENTQNEYYVTDENKKIFNDVALILKNKYKRLVDIGICDNYWMGQDIYLCLSGVSGRDEYYKEICEEFNKQWGIHQNK